MSKSFGSYGSGPWVVAYEDAHSVQLSRFETESEARAWLASHPGGEVCHDKHGDGADIFNLAAARDRADDPRRPPAQPS